MRRLADRYEYCNDAASALGESYTPVLTMIEVKNMKRYGVTLYSGGRFL